MRWRDHASSSLTVFFTDWSYECSSSAPQSLSSEPFVCRAAATFQIRILAYSSMLCLLPLVGVWLAVCGDFEHNDVTVYVR